MQTETNSDRIYYTGDMVNSSGWFTAYSAANGNVRLVEDDGDRDFVIAAHHIGDVYRGNCNPRFVTETAYHAFRAARAAEVNS